MNESMNAWMEWMRFLHGFSLAGQEMSRNRAILKTLPETHLFPFYIRSLALARKLAFCTLQ
jgi:hypothetical protein